MLVSGGKVIAIDSIKKNNTNKSTLSGDGVWTDLGVNTDNIATTEKLKETSANLHKEITATSSYLDQKKQDNLVFKYNKYNDAISSINGSALDAGNKVTVTGDQYIDVSKEVNNDQITYTVVGSAINNRLEGLSGGVNTNKDNIQTLSSNLDNLSGKVNTNTQNISKLRTDLDGLSSKAVTEISGDNLTATKSLAEDGTIKYFINVAPQISDTVIHGENGISAKNQGTIWTIGLSSDFLSANALDNLSGNWQNTYNTVCSYSADWQKVNDKVDTTSFNQYKTEVKQKFVNTSSWASGAFYPLNENPKGYLTHHQSLDGLMSASLLDVKNENIVSYNGLPFSANLVAGSGIIIDGNTIYTSGLVNSSTYTSSINIINEYITVISGDVSAISADLNTKLDTSAFSSISSNFVQKKYLEENYYKKTETSSSNELDDRFEPIENDIDELKKYSAHYTVESSNEFIDVNSANHKFTLTFNSAALQASGNYLSANAFDFLKEPSANWNSVYDTVKSNSADWNEVSAKLDTSSFKEVSGKFALSADVDTRLEDTSAWANATFQPIGDYLSASNKFLSANALDNLSGNWESTYNTVTTNSAKWNEVSSLSSKLDISSFEDRTKDWDVTEYTGIEPIYVNDHQISADLSNYYNKQEVYTQEETEEKIAEALANYGGYVTAGSAEGGYPDVTNPSNKFIYLVKMDTTKNDNYYEWIYSDNGETSAWECIGETTMDLTPYLEKTEAAELYQPIGQYVTSSTDTITAGPAWVLVNDNDVVKWSGLDVSELGKKYIVTSTNNTVYVGSAQNGNTITYNLSANIPTIPGISGENGLSAFYDIDTNKYYVGVNNSGLTYYRGEAGTINNGIVQFSTNDAQVENITVNNGIFTLPANVSKVTFSINETIENNISTTNNVPDHNFNLNKIALYCNDSEVISTQEYYHNELGLSELSLTYTIDNNKYNSNIYSIRYGGVPLTGTFKCNLSILEEVLSFNEGGGTASANYEGVANNLVHVDNTLHKIYADQLEGIAPIYVSGTNMIGLNFDPNQFTISGEGLHSTLQIKIETSGGTIDQEAFEKMADLINSRMTETIPIGMINNVGTLGAGASFSYLFRPIMEFDAYSGTVARVMTSNGTVGTSKTQVVISEVNETNGNIDIQWWSDKTTLTAQAGTVVLTAAPGCTDVRILHPEKLYYATVINYDQTTHYLGFKNDFTSDVGTFDVAYYNAHGAGDYGNDLPGSLHPASPDKLGQTAGATLKPYIGFRNEG